MTLIADVATAAPFGREPDLRFSVRGVPGPQGSKDFKGFSRAGHAILVESSKLVKPWRQDVVAAAVNAMEDQGSWRALTGAVHVVIEFYLARPKSQPKTRRTVPITIPDVDKTVRATLDALKTAGVYRDDSLVTDITARKRYVVQDPALGHPWELPGSGAVISVFALRDEETWADSPLDLSVSQRFPIPTLPDVILESAGHTSTFMEGTELGQLFLIRAGLTDGQSVQVARKALTLVEKRRTMPAERLVAAPPATVIIEDGITRLSSVPGQPMSALQSVVADIAELGVDVGVTILLVDDVSQG